MKLKNFIGAVVATAGLFVSICDYAVAGAYFEGRLTRISIRDEYFGNLAYVHVANIPQVPSPCAGNSQWFVIGEVTNPKYMMVYAALTNAINRQQTVKLWGTGQCTRRPGVHEDVEGFEIVVP